MNTNNIMKWAIGIVVVIVLFFWINLAIENRSLQFPTPSTTSTTTTIVASNPVYTDPAGFTVMYPSDFVLATTSPDNGMFASGTSFLVPSSLVTGTNLGADSRIYVETRTATSTCTSDQFADSGYVNPKTPYATTTINGIEYTTTKTGDAGAGNYYETTIYATKANDKCVAIELFTHSTNIQNYDPGTVQAFDQDKLNSDLNIVLESFKAN